MKQRNLKILLAVALAVLLLTGCAGEQANGDESSVASAPSPTLSENPIEIDVTPTPMPGASDAPVPSPQKAQSANKALTALLPSKNGFEWVYTGTAEYGQSMSLASISQSNEGAVYLVKGQVADLSGGESGKDLSFEETYTAGEDSLYLSIGKGNAMMDSKFADLEIIRLPLKQGGSWQQQAVTDDGAKTTLDCSIESVKKVDGRNEYTVAYKEKDGTYYEKRKIREGFGIVSFEMPEGGSGAPVGYSISELMSGYEGCAALNAYLPQTNVEMHYFGLAEYGHKGTLQRLWSNAEEAVYEFAGEYEDGVGIPDKFVVRYYFDYLRGTVTEKAVSNERTDAAQVNSMLHNLVLLKYPVQEGATWSHNAALNSRQVKVIAKVAKVDKDAGTVTVTYTAKDADGYYDDTYIEKRTFKKGYGMVSFSNLMPGEIEISDADAKDPEKKADILANHMFGYQLRDY